jgi:hypothetical protein
VLEIPVVAISSIPYAEIKILENRIFSQRMRFWRLGEKRRWTHGGGGFKLSDGWLRRIL